MRGVDPLDQADRERIQQLRPTADWIGWNRTVLQTLRNTIDYIAIHTYISNRENDFERFLGVSQMTVDRYIETTPALIARFRRNRIHGPSTSPTTSGTSGTARSSEQKLEEVYNFEDALAMGMFFNSFFRHADVVKMANLAQMVNVIAPIMTNDKGLFLQPIYFPIAEYGQQRGNTSLDVWVVIAHLQGRPTVRRS